MSNFCMYCKELLVEINKNNVQNEINFISVDRDGTNNPVIPPYVNSVPTLIVQGEPSPIIGENVFKWIEKLKTKTQTSKDGPDPWHIQEMGQSYSDSYSFLEGDSSNSTDAIPHHFSYVGSSQQINTPQEGGGGGNNTMSQQQQQPVDELSKRMEMLQSQREQDVNAPVQRI